MNDTPSVPDHRTREAAVPEAGALGLLALGYKGVEAWRAARGSEWIEVRRREWEAGKAAAAAAEREKAE